MTIDVKEALNRLGISDEVLRPKEDILYDELVRQCIQDSSIPIIGRVSSAAGISPGSTGRIIRILVNQGRAIKIGTGLYVPVVDDSDDTG